MRTPASLAALLLAAFASPLAAQGADHEGHAAPAGWSVRADGKADPAGAKVVSMGQGIHVTTGPAVILYRPDTEGTGPLHAFASITQTKPSAHPEGYGLLIGGKALEGPAQQYIYFLIRQDGAFLIKRRDGEKTSDISKGWVVHPAVKKLDPKGSATNMLEVDNKFEPTRITFKVNGQDVYSTEAGGLDLSGMVGIRANHNLDLHVGEFGLHR